MSLPDKYKEIRDRKDSVLCVGLDPAPEKIEERDIFDFCMNVIEETADYVTAYKPNSQFLLFSLNLEQLKRLNERIHQKGCISILDHKLGDIGTSNKAAFYWIGGAGFDALTFSPFAGNIKEAVEDAHRNNLGLFVLTLMSNPEAVWIQKETRFGGKSLYLEIARRVKSGMADGVVVGATIDAGEIRKIRELTGENAIFLCPGIGAQGGDAENVINAAGENLLINVGRSIIYDKNPGEKAKEFCELFRGEKKKIGLHPLKWTSS